MLEIKSETDQTNGRFNIAEEKISEYEDTVRSY